MSDMTLDIHIKHLALAVSTLRNAAVLAIDDPKEHLDRLQDAVNDYDELVTAYYEDNDNTGLLVIDDFKQYLYQLLDAVKNNDVPSEGLRNHITIIDNREDPDAVFNFFWAVFNDQRTVDEKENK